MNEPFDVDRALADVAYTAIGFGLLGFQRAQVRRRELTRQLGTVAGQLEAAARQAAVIAGLFAPEE